MNYGLAALPISEFRLGNVGIKCLRSADPISSMPVDWDAMPLLYFEGLKDLKPWI